MIPMTRFLRLALTADAVASGAAGFAFVVAPQAIGGLAGLPPALLLAAGLLFLPYAALCAWLAARGGVPRAVLWGLAGANLLLALDCAALPLLGFVAPNGLGIALLAALAVTVAVFAELYVITLRRAPAATAP